LSKKRVVPKEDEKANPEVNLNVETYTITDEIPQVKLISDKTKVSNFKLWKFGSINIRSGKEKGEGS